MTTQPLAPANQSLDSNKGSKSIPSKPSGSVDEGYKRTPLVSGRSNGDLVVSLGCEAEQLVLEDELANSKN